MAMLNHQRVNHLVAWQFHDNSSWSIGLSCLGKNPSSSQSWSTRLALKTGRLITWVCLRWFVYFVNGKSTMTGESIKWFVFLGTPNQQIHSRCPWKNDTIRFPREFHHGLPLLRVSSAHVWSSYYYMSYIYIYISLSHVSISFYITIEWLVLPAVFHLDTFRLSKRRRPCFALPRRPTLHVLLRTLASERYGALREPVLWMLVGSPNDGYPPRNWHRSWR